MTYAPPRLVELRAYLKPWTGLSDAALGIVGDENHNGGYHHGWDDRRIVNGATADYSWNESPRDGSHRTNAASAIDIGLFPRLRELSNWLVAQCEAGTADTQDIRSIIYSPDGRTVRRWDRLRRRDTGDSSHLTHTHVSFFRDAESRNKTQVFRRFFEGGGMEQSELLTGKTGSATRTIGDHFADDQNRRNYMIGDAPSPVFGDVSLAYPRKDSPDWNLAHLPELLEEHGRLPAPIDIVVLKAALTDVLKDPLVVKGIAEAVCVTMGLKLTAE